MKKSELKKRLVEALTPDEAAKVEPKYKETYAAMIKGKGPLKLKKYDNPDKVVRGRVVNTIKNESLKIAEKLGKTADVGDYKDDFRKSDAPQFKGKSKKKRDQMATAAFLNKEEQKLDEIDNLMNETGQEIAKKNMDDYKRLNELVKSALMGPINETLDDKVYDLVDRMLDVMGGSDNLLEELIRAMSTKDAMFYLSAIARDYGMLDGAEELEEKQRPDYPDIDGDGDTKEPMVKAAKDKEKAEANESFKSLSKDIDKQKGKTKEDGDNIAGYIANIKRKGGGKGPTAKQKKRMAETILKELRGSINEMAGEDLELKSLAKKFIPIFKKYGMKVDYKTDTKSIEMKPKVGPQGVPATLIISKAGQDDGKGGYGMLTVAVYWLSLADAKNDRRLGLQELDMGSGPSKQDYIDADEMANKIYKELMAVVPKDEFDSIAPPKMNKWGNYLIYFRLKK